MKKILMMGGGLLLIIAIAAGGFLFLNKKGVMPGQQITLKYWGLWEEKGVIDSLITE